MYQDTTFPPPDGRLAQFARLLADFERDEIEAAVDGLIAMLDQRDGDADLEPNGDELDLSAPFALSARFYPDTRPADAKDAEIALATEDDEDDGTGDEDDDPLEDDDPAGGNAEDSGEAGAWPERDGKQPDNLFGGCVDGTEEDDERGNVTLLAAHRDRIRRTRCDVQRVGGREFLFLKDRPTWRPSFTFNGVEHVGHTVR